ncbi:glycosyltransferase involved in cell wall biosynthesis [Microbacterium trichothecenolyticum]|nr:glycosyltransferase involved in cell wall biosynthesis [Microbacterium trichothecenolyticum]
MTTTLVDRRFSTTVEQVGQFSLRKILSAMWMPVRLAARTVRFRPVTVIFFATNRTFSFLVDCALSGVLRLLRRPTIMYIHTVGYSALANRGRLWAWLVRWNLNAADRFVLLGPALARDVVEFAPRVPITYIPNTVRDPSPVSAVIQPRNSILFLSNLIPEKGADTFLDAAVELAPRNPGIEFHVAGAIADREFFDALQARVSSTGLADRIRFLGPLSGDAKWNALRGAIALAFPSTYPFEAQPLTIIEALSVGTPTVAFNVGGVGDIVRDCENGFLVSPGAAAELAARLQALIGDPKLQARLSARARSDFESRFSLSHYQNKWTDIVSKPTLPRPSQTR